MASQEVQLAGRTGEAGTKYLPTLHHRGGTPVCPGDASGVSATDSVRNIADAAGWGTASDAVEAPERREGPLLCLRDPQSTA